MKRAILMFALVLAGCGGGHGSSVEDLGSVSFPADDSPCELIERCALACAADAGTSCATKCESGANQSAITLYEALASCVENVCSNPGDAAAAPCDDPSSVDCQRCRTNSAFKTPAQCVGGPSYCGACSSELTACFM